MTNATAVLPYDFPRISSTPTVEGLQLITSEANDLDERIEACGFLPRIIPAISVLEETRRSISAAGIPYEIYEERVQLVNDVVEHSYLQDMAAEVWPGALIQGEPLTRGDTSVIALPRGPGTVSIVTDLVSATPGGQSAHVDSPSAASIADARRALLQQLRPSDSAGIINAQYFRANTMREVGTKLGVDVRGGAFAVDVDASYDSSYKSSTVVAAIRQMYYAAAFEPDRGGGATGAFDGTVTADQLEPFIGVGNPPLMMTGVHYGRVIIVTASASASSQELMAAVKAQWDAAVSGTVSVSGRYRELIDSAQVRVYAVGATSTTAPGTLTNPFMDLDKIYRDGLALSVNNPGAPIAFSARHVLGGTLAHVGLVAEYVQPVRAVAGDVDRYFAVWDGPGGGAVDTGIDVAPGDSVTISATGQVWSGVWFTPTHGPEGWPNWSAPTGAPAPAESAHCLVARMGAALGGWFKVGSFWSGTNQEGQTGRLQLNINDNNPYNGDATKRFSVRVNVVRRPASAAGIYV